MLIEDPSSYIKHPYLGNASKQLYKVAKYPDYLPINLSCN